MFKQFANVNNLIEKQNKKIAHFERFFLNVKYPMPRLVSINNPEPTGAGAAF